MDNKIRIIICGSRGFTDYIYFKRELDKLFQNNLENLVIYSGCASGPDNMAIQYCKERNIYCEKFPADWDTHGKSAGYIRNVDMAKFANAVLAFWNNKSRGTKHMIDIANKKGLSVKIINV
jgi:hypothetical protein